jgi:2-methylisocitrate lyase-like PEP mutase family enzyme
MISSPGARFRSAIGPRDVLPCIGVYDVFSATLAAREFDALFVSGFGFAASYYGLPDMGFITWSDIAAFVGRLRTVLPRHHLLVDIDDGYCDVEVACHVVSLLERSGASGVVLEDQRRPRRCGHFDGKQIMDLDEFLVKLDRVLSARTDMVVVARTDASEPAEIRRRVHAFVAAGADVVLVDGVKDLNLVRDLRAELGHPFAFNQIAGGKSPALALDDLQRAGVSLAIYSTPCLFAAQEAITASLAALKANDGRLPQPSDGHVGVAACTAVLQGSLPSPPAASDSRVRRVS